MKFTTKKPEESIISLARKLGYIPRDIVGEEFNCVKPLRGRDYPRFHLYLKENKEKNELLFNLHLDQKKPSYAGTPAHSGEYTGEVVENEAERIKKALELFRKML